MNNHTFFITEAYIRPSKQQPHGLRKNTAPYKGINILDQQEHQHRACGQAMHHILGVPTNTAP